MAKRFQGGILGVGFNPLQAPNAPTIGTATAGGASASVAFTAPANVGGGAITGYLVISSPGNINATGSSSPITVSGLTPGTAYTFRVTALNSYGPSPISATSNSVTPFEVVGQQAFTTPGTYTWVAPAGVTSVSVVAVGAGRGASWFAAYGGGGLGWRNNISVTPGASYTITVGAGSAGVTTFTYPAAGGDSTAFFSTVVTGGGTPGGASNSGGTFVGQGGGNGGSTLGSGAGGAGGYTGSGGTGGSAANNGTGGSGGNGAGGGGGGGGGTGYYDSPGYLEVQYAAGPGGGVGLLGQGVNGSGGEGKANNSNTASSQGGGGSGGTSGTIAVTPTSAGGAAGLYGGAGGKGSGAYYYGADPPYTENIQIGAKGGDGAVRIIWPGTTRQFPSTNTGNL